MLQYYNEGLQPVTDTTSTYGEYETGNGVHTFTTVDDVLTKLNSGMAYPEISVNYNSNHSTLTVNALQPANTNNYIFGFVGRSF